MSQFFAAGTTGPVTYEDRQLWLAHEIVLRSGDRCRISFESFRREPLQGLGIECVNRKHRLEVAGQTLNGFTLWTDTAPRDVEIKFLGTRTAGNVALMNVWRLPGYEQVRFAGVNAAAMSVTELHTDEWLLECSDGYGLGAPTFDDLVVRVVIERASHNEQLSNDR